MRIITALAAFFIIVGSAPAQPGGGGKARSDDVDEFIAKMMAFDKNQDGKLSREEITDPRLLRLFDRADANRDGVVTREELATLYQKENVAGGSRGPGDDGPPAGPGGPGGPRGRGSPPRPGQVLPDFLADQLNLTDAQKKQLAEVQKEVDSRLGKILTAEQKDQLNQMRNRGPDRGGPPPN